jgi:hypothetical protein
MSTDSPAPGRPAADKNRTNLADQHQIGTTAVATTAMTTTAAITSASPTSSAPSATSAAPAPAGGPAAPVVAGRPAPAPTSTGGPPVATSGPPAPNRVLVPVYTYISGANHWIGTNAYPAPSGYGYHAFLGNLVRDPEPGTVAEYICRWGGGQGDFLSLYSDCEATASKNPGNTLIGKLGYAYSSYPPSPTWRIMYRCVVNGATPPNYYTTNNANCDASADKPEGPIGNTITIG